MANQVAADRVRDELVGVRVAQRVVTEIASAVNCVADEAEPDPAIPVDRRAAIDDVVLAAARPGSRDSRLRKGAEHRAPAIAQIGSDGQPDVHTESVRSERTAGAANWCRLTKPGR
jgi:hypothetical protein